MNILVYLEERNGQIRKPSLEAIAAANTLGGAVTACFVSSDATALVTDQIKKLNVAKIVTVSEPRLKDYSSRATAKAVAEVAKQTQSDVVIVGATGRGKDLAPRVAVRLNAGYVPDVVQLTASGGDIVATHPVYAGKANVQMKVTTAVKVFSNRPNLWKADKSEASAEAPVEAMSVAFDDKDFSDSTKELVLSQGKIDVAEADVIVSGGRGMKGPEHWPVLESLAEAFGAATGASRAVVDAGWRPHSEQVGQTGKTVSPTLYVAVGISGAVQHLAGMSSSKTIVAINKDPNAPIFSVVDYGIVGDVFEILPALTAEVKRIRHH